MYIGELSAPIKHGLPVEEMTIQLWTIDEGETQQNANTLALQRPIWVFPKIDPF